MAQPLRARSAIVGNTFLILVVRMLAASDCSQADQDLPDPEQPHGEGHEVDVALQVGNAEVEADRAGQRIQADASQDQPQDRHGQALERRRPGQVRGQQQAQHGEGEVLGRAELQRGLRQRRRHHGQADARRPSRR